MEVYLDQNVWHHVRAEWPACEFRRRLNASNMRVCLGLHNIYEFARCLLDEEKAKAIATGQACFQYLWDMDVDTVVDLPDRLIRADLVRARTGAILLSPANDRNRLAAAQNEIYRLGRGCLDDARKFLQNRENEISKSEPLFRESILQANDGRPRPKDFTKMRDTWEARREILDGSEFRKESQALSDSVLFSKPETYPFLNTYINAQLYFTFIALNNPQGPSAKLNSDYRHLISANAAGVFVTEDKQLRNNASSLCPWITVLGWDDLKQKLTP